MKNEKNYVWPVTSISKADMDFFTNCIKANTDQLIGKQLAIFGAGIKGNEYLIYLQKIGYENIVFIDNNEDKQGGKIENCQIYSLDIFMEKFQSYVIFIAVESGEAVKKQLELKGLIDNKDFFYFGSQIYDWFMNEFKKKGNFKYLFFGDCEFTAVSLNDLCCDNLSEMAVQKFGPDSSKALTMHGMGMRAYYNMLKAQVQYGINPEKIILEVNPLTFTKTRHLLPRSQHVGLLERVAEVSPNEELHEYIVEAKQRFNNFQSDFFVNKVKSKGESQNRESLKIYIKLNYMYKFDENVEGIVYLRKLIRYCHSNNIEIRLFLPPANYMLAEKFYGELFWDKYNLIRGGIKEIVAQENEKIVDYSKLLTEDQFAAKETPDETANYEGRKILLECLYNDFGD